MAPSMNHESWDHRYLSAPAATPPSSLAKRNLTDVDPSKLTICADKSVPGAHGDLRGNQERNKDFWNATSEK
jgi:hypothetical protein